ncbi:sarcosine oxidase subunit gamma [Granulosicoccus sp. 3-233]|uniref:sarcosine oxidase subunit gamma n=1 Tax=Granulosicoccus sp. 3-233 TaxID=3417969 RepID=UPI003D3550E3
MANSTLKASYPLDSLDTLIADTRLSAVENLDIISVALPRILPPEKAGEAHDNLEKQLQTSFGLALPAVGALSRNGEEYALLGLQPGLWFLVTSRRTPEPARNLKTVLRDTAYLTDQSDSWAILDIAGPRAQAALERICAIDVDRSAFDETRVVRTIMEHLSVVLERPEPERFRLYSPVSSAQSFLHSVRVSVQNVV